MSEFTIRGKTPQPIEYSSNKLQIRQSPAHQQPTGNTSQKVEFRGQAQQHTMGRRSGQATASAVPSGASPAGSPVAPLVQDKPRNQAQPGQFVSSSPAATQGRPVQRAAGSVAASASAVVEASPEVTAPPVVASLSPASAMLCGQLLEQFIVAELDGPRANSSTVQLAEQTLIDIHPMLPPGVNIPSPRLYMEPLAAPADQAPTSVASPQGRPGGQVAAKPEHEITPKSSGFACSCGRFFQVREDMTTDQIMEVGAQAAKHAGIVLPAAPLAAPAQIATVGAEGPTSTTDQPLPVR